MAARNQLLGMAAKNPVLTRVRPNGQSSISLLGEAEHGHSSGEAIAEIDKMAKSLPTGVAIEWVGLRMKSVSLAQKPSRSTAPR